MFKNHVWWACFPAVKRKDNFGKSEKYKQNPLDLIYFSYVHCFVFNFMLIGVEYNYVDHRTTALDTDLSRTFKIMRLSIFKHNNPVLFNVGWSCWNLSRHKVCRSTHSSITYACRPENRWKQLQSCLQFGIQDNIVVSLAFQVCHWLSILIFDFKVS